MPKKPPTYYDHVFEVTRRIPKGRVTNYGSIADFLALGSARMVGWALRYSHSVVNVPAHRVVNRKGELSGRHHFDPPESMAERLQAEGVTVIDNKVVDFDSIIWKPQEGIMDEELDDLFD